VDFAPDIARVSLVVRAEAPSASAAASSVNARARAVVDAMRKLGIPDGDIKTSGYDISYQPPPPPPEGLMQPAPGVPMPGQVQIQSIARKPIPPGASYVATETIDVKSSIDKAGNVLDAGLTAGADETYGISFDTSMRDALYRKALARAVADARAQAEILAQAAGVRIAGVQSIGTTSGGMPMPMAMMGMRTMSVAGGPPPVMGGTGTIDAMVGIVYRIR
jgi:hypothetical protein